MAKRMTDKEIQEYIKSKSITQDQYVAPTVQTHVDTRNRAPAMVQVAQTVKPTQTIKQNTFSKPQNNSFNIQKEETKDIRTVDTVNKKEPKKEEKQDTLNEAIKKYGDTIKNSAVKNRGLSWDNVVTDLANMYDARKNVAKSIPVIGNLFKAADTVGNSAVNVATNMGTGALKTLEGVADTASDLVFNPMERRYNYAYDLLTKGKKVADENLKDLTEMQQRDIKKNVTQELQDKVGYSDIVDDLEKDSLVKRENFAGQVAQGVGGMVPALVMGQAFGAAPELSNTAGLTGKQKLAAMAGNVGRTYMSQLPSNAILGASSYGSGVEEALEKGATMEQARRYGLANAAIEQGTEMLTGGVPGLQGKGGLDQIVDPVINRNTNGYLNALLRYGYGALGEGLEEYSGTYLDALARQGLLGEKVDWDEVRKEARRAGALGSATGAILNAPSSVQDIQNIRTERAVDNAFGVGGSDVQAQYNPEYKGWERLREQERVEAEQKEADSRQRKAEYERIQQERAQEEARKAQEAQKEQERIREQERQKMLEEARKTQQEKAQKDDDYNKYYKRANLNNFDNNVVSKAKEIVASNKQGRRTKQQWLDIADNIGMQLRGQDADTIKKYAYESFKYERPNVKENLNRQGQKYVSFKVDEWVNAVENAANQSSPDTVQSSVEDTQQATQSETQQNNELTPEQQRNLKQFRDAGMYASISKEQFLKNNYYPRLEQEIGLTREQAGEWFDNSKTKEYKQLNDKMQELYRKDIVKKNIPLEERGDFVFNAYDKNLSYNEMEKKLEDAVYSRVQKDTVLDMAKNQAKNFDNKEEFIKKWYNKEGDTELGISKDTLGDIYDNQVAKTGKKPAKNLAAKVEDNVLTVRNKSGKEIKLKQDSKNKNVYNREPPKTYGKSVVPKEVMENQLVKLKDGTKISNYYSNITEKSKFITQENVEKLSKEDLWRYAPITNKETMENASKEIGDTQKSLENAYGDFMSKDFTSAEDVAKGWIFLKRFQDAGNYDGMVQVIKKMRQSGTTGGQIVQAYNIMSRLTPEGMVKYAQSELMDAEKTYNKGNSKKMIDKYAKNFELTGDEVEYISKTMKKIESMPDGREKKVELAKIQKMLQDKLPPQKGQALKGWMRISMLFNPKTQIRNIAGNAMINPVNTLADVAGSFADRLIGKQTGVRTLGAPTIGSKAEYLKGVKQGAVEAWQDYKMGVDTKDLDIDRFEVGQGKTFNEDNKLLKPFAKALNKTNDILGLAMSGGDRIFYQGAFNSSLYNQMKLNNVDTPTQDMIDIATSEALSRTWNDNNDYTKFVIDIRNNLNKFSTKLTGQSAYGLGDVLIPFAKTPANLTKAIYDYSPLGLASSLFETKNIKNAIETGQITPQIQHEFAQNVGKGVAGSMLYILGYALAKAGITSGANDDDKDVADFIKNTMGIQPYSIKIGDHSYTYDWAQPVAAPFAITADAYKNQQNKKNDDATNVFNTVVDAANTGLNVLLNQSFFSGMQQILNNNEGVINGIQEEILSLPARAWPTFLKQVNDMVDRTQRTAYERNQPIQTAKQNTMSKIIGQSNKLAPKVDTLGNEIQKYGGDKNDVTYFLKAFLSPTNTSNAQTSDISSEIYKVYEETGDKTIMPRVAPYYITNKTIGTKDLTSQERAKYQKTSGKMVSEAMIDLLNDEDYQSLSAEEKAEVINGIVNYSDAKAKEEITGKIANYYSAADKKITAGMAISDYYLNKTLKKRK